MKTFISAIAAMAENRVIGRNNQLAWRLPADLKHFKSITSGHSVLMGRKTYQSIGKPLPNRRNLILTRDPTLTAPGCEIVTSVQEALTQTAQDDQLFIIGGAEIYQLFMPHIKRIYLTVVHADIEGDTYFPPLDPTWKQTSKESHEPDEANHFRYSFMIYDK